MPIYEYLCQVCKRRSSIFFRSYSQVGDPACSHCGSPQVTRLVSRFAVAKSEESRLDDMADPGKFGDLDENDPRSVAKWARRMGQEMGEDMGPEFDEMVEHMEAGEMPEDMEGGEGDLGEDLE
ncbi:MAG TPA: zinc ribbon domain-containing protein [Dehalococcoidia bacterium]|nr:zinc ribbon domain-containing protein [Dehalococcoidia bacterium]